MENNNLEKIDYAILKTLEAHPDLSMADQLSGYVFYNFDLSYFTNKDGARDTLAQVSHDDFIYEMCKFGLECGRLYEAVFDGREEKMKDFISIGKACYEYYCAVYHSGKNPYFWLKMNSQHLNDIAYAFGYYRYHHFSLYRSLINEYGVTIDDRLENAYFNNNLISNLNVRTLNINKCRKDVASGKQFTFGHVDYKVDGCMFAVSDVGRVRENQEDGVLLMHHPDNKNYRLVAVADGMGGGECGELASNKTLQALSEWFEHLSVELLDNPEELNPIVASEISKINRNIFEMTKGEGGTTLSLIIVCNGSTLTVSIGDSRIYMMKDGTLTQISTDDSYVQRLYMAGEIKTKDDMRFHKRNNEITKGIGIRSYVSVTDMKFIDDYDILLLFTDGVTDCMSDSEIKIISELDSPKKIASNIITYAKYNISHKKIISEDEKVQYYDTIEGGKDNLTAAVYYPGRRG